MKKEMKILFQPIHGKMSNGCMRNQVVHLLIKIKTLFFTFSTLQVNMQIDR